MLYYDNQIKFWSSWEMCTVFVCWQNRVSKLSEIIKSNNIWKTQVDQLLLLLTFSQNLRLWSSISKARVSDWIGGNDPHIPRKLVEEIQGFGPHWTQQTTDQLKHRENQGGGREELKVKQREIGGGRKIEVQPVLNLDLVIEELKRTNNSWFGYCGH